jgi:tetratricopeptide (TPR) repeat protein
MEARTANVLSQAMLASDILEEFERTVELDSMHIPGRIGVVNFHLVAPGIVGGDIDKAEYHAKKLINLDEVKGRTALARIYLKQEKMDLVEEQIKILEEKFEGDKSLSQFYNSIGYYYLGQNKYEEAIVAFKKQVKLNPESANSYDSLGDGYKAAGRNSEAIVQYKKALEINPNFSASIKNLEELEKR